MSEHPYVERKLNTAFDKLEAAARKAVERIDFANHPQQIMIDLDDGHGQRPVVPLSHRPVSLPVQGKGFDVSHIEHRDLFCYVDPQGEILGFDRFAVESLHYLRADGNIGSTDWRKISRKAYLNTVLSKIERSKHATYDLVRVDKYFMKSIISPISELTKLCKQLRPS